MQQNAAQSYQLETARSATPIGGVVALFETILRDFRRASAAISAGNVEARVAQLNHALTVIAELQGVLDFERGGVAAKRFLRFYQVTRGLIMEANLRSTQESIDELVSLYTPICSAWKTIDGRVPPSEYRPANRRNLPTESAPSAEGGSRISRWDA
jgi:flagellar secretion chaperone FliS